MLIYLNELNNLRQFLYFISTNHVITRETSIIFRKSYEFINLYTWRIRNEVHQHAFRFYFSMSGIHHWTHLKSFNKWLIDLKQEVKGYNLNKMVNLWHEFYDKNNKKCVQSKFITNVNFSFRPNEIEYLIFS